MAVEVDLSALLAPSPARRGFGCPGVLPLLEAIRCQPQLWPPPPAMRGTPGPRPTRRRAAAAAAAAGAPASAAEAPQNDRREVAGTRNLVVWTLAALLPPTAARRAHGCGSKGRGAGAGPMGSGGHGALPPPSALASPHSCRAAISGDFTGLKSSGGCWRLVSCGLQKNPPRGLNDLPFTGATPREPW